MSWKSSTDDATVGVCTIPWLGALRKMTWLAGVAAAFIGPATGAWSQAAPSTPAAPSGPAESQPGGEDDAPSEGETEDPGADRDEIFITADPSVRSSIDRTTYVIRDNAEARTSSTLELLGRIPSVEVTPTGILRLLGRSGVTVLIDGNEVTNPGIVLRNLQGSQVARIEVITNPSAQYSAQGTGGIINIVTRRSVGRELGGSLTASAGSFGTYEAKASPTWSRGGLSVSGSVGRSRSVAPLAFVRDRRSLENGIALFESVERGTSRSVIDTLTGNFLATYRPAPRQTFSLNAILVGSDSHVSRQSDLLAPLGEDLIFRQTSTGRTELSSRDLRLSYARESAREGELLTISGSRSGSFLASRNDFVAESGAGASGTFNLRTESSTGQTTFNLDYVRPSGEVRRLSLGAVIQRTSSLMVSRRARDLPLSGMISETSTIGGSWVEKAAYATYQFPLLGNTILAGLRVEDRRYQFTDNDLARTPDATYLFPSLHLERRLTTGLVANLSYSRRIAWPGIADLDPELRFVDSTTASAGNPLLRPEFTDSFEAKMRVQHWRQDVELTLYSRETRNLLSSESDLSEGVLVTRSINLGERRSIGASLSARGPLGGGFRYSASINLSDQSVSGDRIDVDLVREGPQYSAFAQLEYRDGREGRRGADRIEVRARFSGPIETGFYRISPFMTVNATWSHALTDRLSGVLTVSDLIGPPEIEVRFISGNIHSVQTDRSSGPRVNLSLAYSLGPPPAR